MRIATLPCHFDGDDAPGAPRVWACLWQPVAASASPETTRQRARDQARAALRALLADAYRLPASVIQLTNQRGARVRASLAQGALQPPGWSALGLSISHAEGDALALIALALIALCPAGPVGVDLASVPAGWANDAEALRRQAALYLGPSHAAAIGDVAAGDRAQHFAQGWAELEARLKCLEQPLTEWSPALAQRLARCSRAALRLPPEVRQTLPAASRAAVAWMAPD